MINQAGFVWPRKVNLFGVEVSVTHCEEAAAAIVEAARRGIPGIVACQAVHAIMLGSTDASLGDKMNAFDMITPDGQPVRWAMNLLHRTALRDRVRGADLTAAVCRRAAAERVPVYLYGSSPEVLTAFHTNLTSRYSELQVVGTESPPFRSLTCEEDEATVRHINQSGAGILLVGLGCPKQDLFAYEHRGQIRPVQVCVGAVFDFFGGKRKTAPVWMQRYGLEWLFRLLQEPRRLWWRYLTTNSLFVVKLTGELICRARWFMTSSK
jgi:N-acetylglucosaminyldiphosphoundecaprenol N-acetyl-beta-D-mannosaminyltransferase